MIVALSISPSGTPLDHPGNDPEGVPPAGAGVSEAVAAAVGVIRASGLPCETNAMFTNIEGEWDEVMGVVKQAVDEVACATRASGSCSRPTSVPGTKGSQGQGGARRGALREREVVT